MRTDVIVVEGLLGMGFLIADDSCWWTGHPWNVREGAWGCASQWGAPAVHQEFSVIDDAGA